MQSDSHKSLFRSARHFFSGTMISRITGMGRDIAIAYAFGTQNPLAAFMIAFRFAHLIRRLLGEGAMQTAFIPHFEELRQANPQKAFAFFINLSASVAALLLLLIPVTMLALKGWMAWGNLNPDNQEIVQLTSLMFPSLFFICLYGLNSSLLQCEKQYFVSGVAPALFNIIWIAGIFVCSAYPSDEAMVLLSYFIIAAAMGQWLFTLPWTLRILKQNHLQSFWQSLDFRSADLKTLSGPLLVGILGVSAAQINNFLDALFARYASLEGPAYLWYAIRLQQLPLALFGIALSGALLPPLSRALRAGQTDQFISFFDAAARKTVLLMIPITVAIALFGDTAINALYGRGHFTDESTRMTALCLWGYGLGLIPMALVLLMAPAFYAKKNYKTPTRASLAAMGINCVLNGLCVGWFEMGAFSVALATSVSAWINCALLWKTLKTTIPSPFQWRFTTLIADVLGASLIGAAIVLAVDHFFFRTNTAFEIMRGIAPIYSRNFAEQWGRLLIESGFFFFSTAAILAKKHLRKEVFN